MLLVIWFLGPLLAHQGTPFQEFVAAVRNHAKSDGAVEWHSTAYWICTFSNNQWEVGQTMLFGHVWLHLGS